ncbi:MAG: hypothetical protein M1481_05220 [Candidatus Thermoplasmatota archaeon]|nr:hypothetical protein [Candidatus Thermoplasmatota archaeon]MCL5963994.1 hypothetical protein [Candidatus Thermoplasmatota archaeon]
MKRKIDKELKRGETFVMNRTKLMVKHLGDPYTINEIANIYRRSLNFADALFKNKKIDEKEWRELKELYTSILKIAKRAIEIEIEYVESRIPEDIENLNIKFEDKPKRISKNIKKKSTSNDVN